MLKLNLIAEEDRQTLKFQRLFFLFLKVEIVLLILVLLAGTVIFGAKKILAANIYQGNQETARMI
ncbi:MAG TPA: hypothetical protein VMC41_04290, partial [Candidatus Nanoarchaeia archaeon]|nr:hypothetical protein [Candidatus Nanoarchaeia archaeon]